MSCLFLKQAQIRIRHGFMRNASNSQVYNILKYSLAVKNIKCYHFRVNAYGNNISPQITVSGSTHSPPRSPKLTPIMLSCVETTLIKVYMVPNSIKIINLHLIKILTSSDIWHCSFLLETLSSADVMTLSYSGFPSVPLAYPFLGFFFVTSFSSF